MKKRQMHSKKFKSQVAVAALRSELTVAEICSRYSIGASRVHSWKKQALEGLPMLFEKQKQQSSNKESEKELRDLYEQIGRLKVENDYLKKKLMI